MYWWFRLKLCWEGTTVDEILYISKSQTSFCPWLHAENGKIYELTTQLGSAIFSKSTKARFQVCATLSLTLVVASSPPETAVCQGPENRGHMERRKRRGNPDILPTQDIRRGTRQGGLHDRRYGWVPGCYLYIQELYCHVNRVDRNSS